MNVAKKQWMNYIVSNICRKRQNKDKTLQIITNSYILCIKIQSVSFAYNSNKLPKAVNEPSSIFVIAFEERSLIKTSNFINSL